MVLKCFTLANINPEQNEIKGLPTETNATKNEKTDNYNPYDYGKETHPSIFWGPVLHLMKTVIGSGILALPYAFQTVGYGVGILGAFLTAALYIHIIQLLLDVEYELCKRLKTPNLTYVGVVQNAFKEGPAPIKKYSFLAQFLVYYHYTVNKCLTNAIYLIIISSNFKIIIDHYQNTDMNVVKIMTVVIIPLTALALIRRLKFLVPFSVLTNVFNIVNVFLILFISADYKRTTEFKAVNDVYKFPYFFALMLGALNGTGIMIPLKNDMKNPKRFSSLFGVLNIALISCTIIYIIFGVMGYLKYGESIEPNVLQNLPPGQLLTLLVLVFYSTSICISYTLFYYITFDTIWTNLLEIKVAKFKYGVIAEYSLRIACNVLPYLLAASVPNFKILVSVSSVMGILIDKGIPPLLQSLVLMGNEKKTTGTYVKLMKNGCLILLILFMFITASMEVIQYILNFYKK